ncbi:hypothetical protein COM34_18895 [Bacillus wiedmannii]|nr:hypothetical protein COM34_18895 [Bacillus wiedmannii]
MLHIPFPPFQIAQTSKLKHAHAHRGQLLKHSYFIPQYLNKYKLEALLLVCFHINKSLKEEDQENRADRGAFDRRTRNVAFLHEYRTGNATTTCDSYLDRTF